MIRLIFNFTQGITRNFLKVTLESMGIFETYTRYYIVCNKEHIGVHRVFALHVRLNRF